MDSSVSPKDEIWFLRVCHHISNAVYLVPLSPKHLPQHPILKHPQYMLLPQCERPGLNCKKNIKPISRYIFFILVVLQKVYFFIPQFLPQPVPMFCGTLAGKYFSGVRRHFAFRQVGRHAKQLSKS